MHLADNVELLYIYYYRGVTPKRSELTNGIKDPPTSGWCTALVVRGEKHSTIFCPYTLKGFHVRNDHCEISQAKDLEPWGDNRQRAINTIHRVWDEHQRRGWQSDYDTAAMVLSKLGAKVPTNNVALSSEKEVKKSGKPAAKKLLKPVKLKTKRGAILDWFIKKEAGSIREAMAEFDSTRSGILTHLFGLNKDHGIGYEVAGDAVKIDVPGRKKPWC